MEEIDARGLACPAPVLLAKDALEKEDPTILQVLVDNEASRENVSRFLESQNYQVEISGKDKEIRITAQKKEEPGEQPSMKSDQNKEHQRIMIMVTTDRMGYGDDELGLKLMINYLKTLKEMGEDLWRLFLVNNGVKLAVAGSETLGSLQELEQSGVPILVCGTCLNHFNLLEQKQVGQTTNMLDIVMAMQFADKVINL